MLIRRGDSPQPAEQLIMTLLVCWNSGEVMWGDEVGVEAEN